MSNTKAQIIKAMYLLIAKYGYDKTSIGKIAKLVGINKSSVYHFFANKEEIFITVIDTYLSEIDFSKEDLKTLNNVEDYQNFVIKIGWDYIDLHLGDEQFCKLYAETLIQSNRISAVKIKILELEKATIATIKLIVNHGYKIGVFSKNNFDEETYVHIINTYLWGMESSIVQNFLYDYKQGYKIFIENLLD